MQRSGTALWDPAAVVRWNADKRYLGELARAGVPVIPTDWIARGTDGELGRRLRRRAGSRQSDGRRGGSTRPLAPHP